ncbi:MAG: U32 family peptidase [Opitutus sp.]|nr:U32 family peptidase [Opitutus sp.]
MSTATIVAPPSPAVSRRRPELLAPAGDWECARAAVENGADAIYFGLERFNARMRAKNFTQADLPALMEFLHRRGVRGYVTFNTLVFANELTDAETYLRTIIAAGVDAAIVQDVGVCRMIRALSPDFPIHCSTQMTITSAAGVEFARALGAQLVVLARENSIADIDKIRLAQTTAAAAMPLEVFVHGALCVAYSGQCLTSESLGGRSANRGECAQACRLPYDLISDGQKVDLGDRRYLLSPQDLAGIDVLPELVQSGVASLKIEGRLKSPEYVASITRTYRKALDALCESEGLRCKVEGAEQSAGAAPGANLTPSTLNQAAPNARYELQMAFSRGLYTGWFRGNNNQKLAHARFGTKRGVFLGPVAHVGLESVSLRLAAPLKPGDGIVFDAGKPDEREEGGRVYQVEARGGVEGESTLRFGHGDIDWRRIRVGQFVWKTNDPALDRELRATFAGDQIRFQRPIALEVHGRAGTPLTVMARDEDGHVVKVESTVPLAVAENQPLTAARLREQLGRLGGTPLKLGELTSHLEGNVILPISELNRVRRAAISALETRRAAPKRWSVHEGGMRTPAGLSPAAVDVTRKSLPAAEPELIAVIRLLPQLDAAWQAGARTIYCEFENPKYYRDAVTRFRELQGGPDSQLSTPNSQLSSSIWVAPPRVFKPGEEWILQQVRSCNADGYLVRNYDHLAYFAGDRKRGDFSLNVANPWTADYFLNHHGLERVTASYDLNVAQLDALLRAAPGAWFDITIHQHMPMFHMEHCVFCAFLSSGKDYRDCGRPCDTHVVTLRDRVGADLPLKADAGCRNTVYNNRAQTGAEFASHLLALGARSFRVEFVNESPGEVQQTLARYGQLLRGEISGADLWRELKLINQLGVTRGQMETAPPVIARKS